MAQDLKAREMHEALEAFMEDHAVLTEHMHAARAAREETERDLATTKGQKDAVRSDWARKLQDRRKEVPVPSRFHACPGMHHSRPRNLAMHQLAASDHAHIRRTGKAQP